MKVKVFQTNRNGKIEFTPAELEELLNKTFEEGYCKGCCEPRFNSNSGDFEKWPKKDPNVITVPYHQELENIPAEKSNHQLVSEAASATTTVGTDSGSSPNTGITIAPSTCSIKVSDADIQTLAKSIEEIISEVNKAIDFSKSSNDVFANLAKELNF